MKLMMLVVALLPLFSCSWLLDTDSLSPSHTADSGVNATCDQGSCNIACDLPKQKCLQSCVDLSNDQRNCGECGHDCGDNAQCAEGLCTPAIIRRDVDKPTGLAVLDEGVIYSTRDTVLRCPLAGCTMAPQQISASLNTEDMVAVPSGVAFLATKAAPAQLYGCPLSGCSDSPNVIASWAPQGGTCTLFSDGANIYYSSKSSSANELHSSITRCAGLSVGACSQKVTVAFPRPGSPFAADDTGLFFFLPVTDSSIPGSTIDTNHVNLMRCDNSSPCTNPSIIRADMRLPTRLVAHGGYLYWQYDGVLEITRCPQNGCQENIKSIAGVPIAPSEFVVDDSGLYWFDVRYSQNPKLMMCQLSGCVGGPKTVVANLVEPKLLRIWKGFLYWTSQGTRPTPSDAIAPDTGAIYRVAKPLP